MSCVCVSYAAQSLTLHSVRHTYFSKEQYVLPEDDRMIETCRSVLSVLMKILNFLNNIQSIS